VAVPVQAVDQYGQVIIDVLLSEHRDTAAARGFFAKALAQEPAPVEVTTDQAGPYLRVIDELVPAAPAGSVDATDPQHERAAPEGRSRSGTRQGQSAGLG
jgi:transposase-like protein